jgi:hypothetical protein
MGYERDRDRATRGPGAIAALDRTSGPRYWKRQQAAQATARRDRVMTAIERGAMGMMDMRTAGERKVGGGSFVVTRPVPTPVKVTPAPIMTPPIVVASPLGPMALLKEFTPDPIPMPMPMPLPMQATPAPGESPPLIAPSPLVTRISAITGGGTGGVRITGGLPKPPVPIDPIVIPPVPDLDPEPPGGIPRTALLLGGAVAAYFLFFHKTGHKAGES